VSYITVGKICRNLSKFPRASLRTLGVRTQNLFFRPLFVDKRSCQIVHYLSMNKDKEIMFLNNTHISDQQYAIIGEACQPVQDGKEGKVIRVNAAAGSGKTTTLEALAWNLIHNHEHPGVIYAVFNKSSADSFNAKKKLGPWQQVKCGIEAKTVHSLALTVLKKDFQTIVIQPDDYQFLRTIILNDLRDELDKLLALAHTTNNTYLEILKQKIIYFMTQQFTKFCQSRQTLTELKQAPALCEEAKRFYNDMKSKNRYCFRASLEEIESIYADVTQIMWNYLFSSRNGGRLTFHAVSKRAQLGQYNLRKLNKHRHFTALVVDESQARHKKVYTLVSFTQY